MPVVAYIILLVIPLVVGSILKLALIDDIPASRVLIEQHIFNGYVKPLWIEFLILLFVVIISWTSTQDFQTERTQPDFPATLGKLFAAIALSLFICAVTAIGLPRWDVDSVALTVILPAFVAFAALAFSIISIRS